jgi:hypothetical protein
VLRIAALAASHVLERFVDACTPGPYCTRAQSANARRIGMVLSDAQGHAGEVITAAQCSGRGKYVRSKDIYYVPLFKHHVCRIQLDQFSPRERTRHMWVYLHVLGPANLANPDAPHNFLLERLPG